MKRFRELIRRAAYKAACHPVPAVGIALFAGIGAFYLSGLPVADIAVRTIREETSVRIAEPSPLDNFSLRAKAAYVYDIKDNKVLYAYNENAPLPLASLTKLMVAVASADILERDATVVVEADALSREGDSGLALHERWRFADLLDFTLLVSSNDGAAALAAAASAALSDGREDKPASRVQPFVSYMNRKAEAIGLRGTYFLNETGLDADESTGGGYGTARDIAALLSYAERTYPGLLARTRFPSLQVSSFDARMHEGENTNVIAENIPGLIGSKTGYTDLAGGNIALLFDLDIAHPIAVVVLGSTTEGRFKDAAVLIEAAREMLGTSLNSSALET